ncbi:MAG: response regulator [Verrucomicrobia bacterium]|nr:response regulator [Verrucomicrobiota bacterium]
MNANTGKRILVVDDEPDVTELLSYKLKREGYLVESINDPLQIMGIAREFNPDLFILDVMMPDLDGLKICRMIRADGRLKTVPIVFLTAKGQTEDRIKGLECGADDYIPKPFDIKELTPPHRTLAAQKCRRTRPRSLRQQDGSQWHYSG